MFSTVLASLNVFFFEPIFFFLKKFAATLAIKIYTKMCKLCVYLDYDPLYIPLNST